MQAFNTITGKKLVSCRGSAEKVKLLVDDDRKQKTRELFKLVHAIHCVSSDMRNTILPYCSQAQKIFVNYPSINAEVFKRSAPYITHTPAKILSVGRFTFQKGYLTGLLAINILHKAGVAFHWTIVGDGPQKEEIIFHINQMGLRQHVTLAGVKTGNEVKELYNNSDIFFLPSVYEGIANVALEAMSMQLPVVCTRSGGMDEVITNGINGMLADVYDSETLAAHLQTLCMDEQLCMQFGQNARNRVLQQFTIETQIQKFEQAYTALL
jgi:colanic acid/amylovoran biosynthesis glycosyltransferase